MFLHLNHRLMFATLLLLISPIALATIDRVLLTTKAPYVWIDDPRTEAPAPAGYRPVMVQHVARHGSRGLSSSDDEDLMYQLWQYAKEQDGLTALGQHLGPQLEEMIEVHQRLGFGQITGLGQQEHRDQARRLIDRLPTMFSKNSDRKILITHSGRLRAAQSGEAFASGLIEAAPWLTEQLSQPQASPSTLYFHSAEGSPDYLDYEENDPELKAVMDTLYAHPEVAQTYRAVLLALFSEEIVDQLASAQLSFTASADPEETLSSIEDAVEALYGLLTIASNLTEEAFFDFSPFFTEQQLTMIAALDDADSFYGRGPGFEGRDVTYRAADALFAEMLMQANEQPLATLAAFRFTHSQVMMPVATWLRLPNAWPGANIDQPFEYDTYSWRSALISPMAANLQWEIWEDDRGHRLVRMLHNEQVVAFPEPCQPLKESADFYPLEEINRCLTSLHPSLSQYMSSR